MSKAIIHKTYQSGVSSLRYLAVRHDGQETFDLVAIAGVSQLNQGPLDSIDEVDIFVRGLDAGQAPSVPTFNERRAIQAFDSALAADDEDLEGYED